MNKSMNDIIDEMSVEDCCAQITALLLSYGFSEEEVPQIGDKNKEAMRKILKALIKIGPKRKIVVNGYVH